MYVKIDGLKFQTLTKIQAVQTIGSNHDTSIGILLLEWLNMTVAG